MARSTIPTHHLRAGRLSAADRRASLIRRSWTKAERRVVWRGFWGRFTIALEPIICFTVFLALTVGLGIRGEFFLAPIFALGVIGFAAYAVWLLLAPLKALAATRAPIYVVDGYLRYRGRDDDSGESSRGYIAVLSHDRSVVHEWALTGDGLVLDIIRPAHIEFSDFGGIHRIDGRPTGVLPDSLPVLGIGLPRS